eukprot:SM000380S14648  [mRNA]  locus=s380:37018:39336:+ [translate_table: standard]
MGPRRVPATSLWGILAALLLACQWPQQVTACYYFGWAGLSYKDCVQTTSYLTSSNMLADPKSGVTGYVDIDWAETKLCWTMVLDANHSISTPAILELRSGEANADGPTVFTVFDTINNAALKTASMAEAAVQSQNNANGGCYYGNISMLLVQQVLNSPATFHFVYRTSTYPNGAARAQLLSERKFFVNLQVVNVVPSIAVASPTSPSTVAPNATDAYAEITYDMGKICWTIILDNPLSDVTSAAIYAGAEGSTGALAVTLFSGSPAWSGCTTVVDLATTYKMRSSAGSYYLGLASSLHPSGFARGQLSPKITIVNRLTASMKYSMTLGNGGVAYALTNWTSSLGTPYKLQYIQNASLPAMKLSMLDVLTGQQTLSGWTTLYDEDYISFLATYPTLYYAKVHTVEDLTNPFGNCPSCYERTYLTCDLCSGTRLQ